MLRREAIKNRHFERKLFSGRAIFAGICITLSVAVLLSRLAYLQIVSYEHFATLSQDNRIKLVALPPPRGLIYDRKGRLLADNVPSYRLEITPSEVTNLDEVLARLGALIEISDSDLRRFNTEKSRKQSFQSIPLRFNLTDEEVARLSVNRYRFPGVEIAARLNREYPLGGTAIHALGYVGRISESELQQVDGKNYNGTSHIGKQGIEKYYEGVLHGTVGYQQVEINAQGRSIRTLDAKPPVAGADLTLSLDADLQREAELSLEANNGAVVAMDPRTGQVLALASMPIYDPNPFVNGISSQAYNALLEDQERPLFNRALTGQYPPGSTIKPFIALAGLQYNITTARETIWAGGYYQLPGESRRYRDWKRGGHGRVDMAKAITQSCDVYFYDLSHRMGIQKIHDFLENFGLGKVNGIDATAEKAGILPSPAWKRGALGVAWYPGETIIAGIGQGFMLTTPLQLATATSRLAMRGRLVSPRLVLQAGQQEAAVAESESNAFHVSRDEYWDQVIEPMIAVVHGPNGTARRIGENSLYKIAGKTGTAQVFGLGQDEEYDAEAIDKKLRDHALFIGFAPADNPLIAVAVIVENGGGGGSTAAPVARRIMDKYLLENPVFGQSK